MGSTAYPFTQIKINTQFSPLKLLSEKIPVEETEARIQGQSPTEFDAFVTVPQPG